MRAVPVFLIPWAAIKSSHQFFRSEYIDKGVGIGLFHLSDQLPDLAVGHHGVDQNTGGTVV